MSTILAIETSTDFASVAISSDGQIYQKTHQVKREAARVILEFVESLLSEQKLSLNSLDAIAFGRGPGSFTGVRLAASITQGLALGANLPVIPVSTLKVLAFKAWKTHGCNRVLATIDARMNEVYSNFYSFEPDMNSLLEGDEIVSPVEKIVLPDNQNCVAVGTGAQHYSELFQDSFENLEILDTPVYPEAKDMLELVQSGFFEPEMVEPSQALPVYIRNQVAKLPNKK